MKAKKVELRDGYYIYGGREGEEGVLTKKLTKGEMDRLLDMSTRKVKGFKSYGIEVKGGTITKEYPNAAHKK